MGDRFRDECRLIEHLKMGDSDAYAYLVDSYLHKLCHYAFSLVNDSMVAQDIVQQVFVRVWERRKSLNTSFSFSNFLYKCVYNEFIDYHRKRRSVTFLEKKYIEGINDIVQQDNQTFAQRLSLLKNAIQNLPTRCQQVFLMSKREGLTNMEIAEYLGVSIKTIERHITRAYSILRKEIS